jgi:hypothetical protein
MTDLVKGQFSWFPSLACSHFFVRSAALLVEAIFYFNKRKKLKKILECSSALSLFMHTDNELMTRICKTMKSYECFRKEGGGGFDICL